MRPARRCRKITGDPEVARTASAIIASRGDRQASAVPATTTSNERFHFGSGEANATSSVPEELERDSGGDATCLTKALRRGAVSDPPLPLTGGFGTAPRSSPWPMLAPSPSSSSDRSWPLGRSPSDGGRWAAPSVAASSGEDGYLRTSNTVRPA